MYQNGFDLITPNAAADQVEHRVVDGLDVVVARVVPQGGPVDRESVAEALEQRRGVRVWGVRMQESEPAIQCGRGRGETGAGQARRDDARVRGPAGVEAFGPGSVGDVLQQPRPAGARPPPGRRPPTRRRLPRSPRRPGRHVPGPVPVRWRTRKDSLWTDPGQVGVVQFHAGGGHAVGGHAVGQGRPLGGDAARQPEDGRRSAAPIDPSSPGRWIAANRTLALSDRLGRALLGIDLVGQ